MCIKKSNLLVHLSAAVLPMLTRTSVVPTVITLMSLKITAIVLGLAFFYHQNQFHEKFFYHLLPLSSAHLISLTPPVLGYRSLDSE